MLEKHQEAGLVRYDRLIGDRDELDGYVASLRDANPGAMELPERIAFWINAYNALVVRSILDAYPLSSTRDIQDFETRLDHSVAGDLLSLENLRNEKIRKEFKDPRISFSLCRGAVSAPKISATLFTASNLEEQLEKNVRDYLAGPWGVQVDVQARKVLIPPIFDWYATDFVAEGRKTRDPEPALRTFLLLHGPPKMKSYLELTSPYALEIRKDYDWRLKIQQFRGSREDSSHVEPACLSQPSG